MIVSVTAWIGVIGALGGVLITALAGLLTATLNHRWQTADKRDERVVDEHINKSAARRDAYVRVLAAVSALQTHVLARPPMQCETKAEAFARLRELRNESPGLFDELEAAGTLASILAGEQVLAALDAFQEAFTDDLARSLVSPEPLVHDSDAFDAAEKSLIAAMRAEQESTPLATS